MRSSGLAHHGAVLAVNWLMMLLLCWLAELDGAAVSDGVTLLRPMGIVCRYMAVCCRNLPLPAAPWDVSYFATCIHAIGSSPVAADKHVW